MEELGQIIYFICFVLIFLYLFIVTSCLYLWSKNAKFKTQSDMHKNYSFFLHE